MNQFGKLKQTKKILKKNLVHKLLKSYSNSFVIRQSVEILCEKQMKQQKNAFSRQAQAHFSEPN